MTGLRSGLVRLRAIGLNKPDPTWLADCFSFSMTTQMNADIFGVDG